MRSLLGFDSKEKYQSSYLSDVPPPLDANPNNKPEKTDIPEKRGNSSVDFIPLYCALLGAVVLGLLIYVIYKHYQRLKEKRAGKEPHEDVEYSKTSGGDSGVYVENEMMGRSCKCLYGRNAGQIV